MIANYKHEVMDQR